MSQTLEMSSALAMATKICQQFESCELSAYHGAADRPGLISIGWGATEIDGQPVQLGTTITQDEADAMLASTLSSVQAKVKALVTVALTDYQEAALISFAYNVGAGATGLGGSTLLKDLNAGDFDAAAQQFGLWDHAAGVEVDGLKRRRAYEAQVFTGDVTP
jgi:GH24 family phage-related lysozyme (muramidase)